MSLHVSVCMFLCISVYVRAYPQLSKTIRRAICCPTVPSRASGTPCGSSYGRFCTLIKKCISNRFSNSVG